MVVTSVRSGLPGASPLAPVGRWVSTKVSDTIPTGYVAGADPADPRVLSPEGPFDDVRAQPASAPATSNHATRARRAGCKATNVRLVRRSGTFRSRRRSAAGHRGSGDGRGCLERGSQPEALGRAELPGV